MNTKKIEIIQDLFKDKETKRSFLEYQYEVAKSVSSIVKKKLEKKIDGILTKWEKKEDDILKYRKNNKSFNLIKTLLFLEIVPRFPNHYTKNEANWLIYKSLVQPEDILFHEIDGKPKLIADMDKKELSVAKDHYSHTYNPTYVKAINNMENKVMNTVIAQS